MALSIRAEDPARPDIAELLQAHLAFSRATSPPGHVHALDRTGLAAPDVTVFAARDGGALLGIGALRDLGGGRAEIKSMHTSAAARGRGVGRSMLHHLIATARQRGDTWLGLETGSMDEFAPARGLYESAGFVSCEPFASYTSNEYSVCMSMDLDEPG